MKKVTALVMFAVMTAAFGFGQDGADLDKRIAEYTQAIKSNPNDAKAYSNRGRAYYGKGDYDKAIADYTQAIRLDPKDAVPYAHRGHAYNKKEDYDRAIADYSEVIRLRPDSLSTHVNRGDAYFNKGDYDKAIADYSESIRIAPDKNLAYISRGDAYIKKGDYNKAIADFSEAIKHGISNLDTYWFRSFAYYHTKNYDAAVADCTTVIQRNPDFPHAYVVRGDAYGAKGLYHKAVADYRTGFEKGYDPSGFVVDKSSKADMWFCGAMYMEITVNRFLGNSAVVTKYENWLKTVCDKSNITRAEVETFYRQNIGALIAPTYMDMQAARFTGSDPAPYAATLKFITDSGNVSETDIKRFIRDAIRSALITEMNKGRNGYVPLEIYNEWKRRGYGDFIGTATDVLVAFFESPTQRNYEAVRGMIARQSTLLRNGDILAINGSSDALYGVIKSLSLDLVNKIDREVTITTQAALAKIPDDPRLNVFSIPYAATQR
jgi:Tfp pilus assembly protein PilF